MHWISTRDKPVPKDGETYLALWKGIFVLIQYDDHGKRFWISYRPSEMGESAPIDSDHERKLYYWCKLEYPQEWLDK